MVKTIVMFAIVLRAYASAIRLCDSNGCKEAPLDDLSMLKEPQTNGQGRQLNVFGEAAWGESCAVYSCAEGTKCLSSSVGIKNGFPVIGLGISRPVCRKTARSLKLKEQCKFSIECEKGIYICKKEKKEISICKKDSLEEKYGKFCECRGGQMCTRVHKRSERSVFCSCDLAGYDKVKQFAYRPQCLI